MMGLQWHQLDDMQIICTSLQTDNHASTSSLSFFTGRMLFLTPNQQRQGIQGIIIIVLMLLDWYRQIICHSNRAMAVIHRAFARCIYVLYKHRIPLSVVVWVECQ